METDMVLLGFLISYLVTAIANTALALNLNYRVGKLERCMNGKNTN